MMKSLACGFPRLPMLVPRAVGAIVLLGCLIGRAPDAVAQSSLTIEDLIPPNDRYAYFEKAGQRPFQYSETTKFELVNAWWLAEASLLAYADKPFVKAKFQNAGINVVELIEGKDTQCYVATAADFVIVAFRGTEVLKWGSETAVPAVIGDWESNLQMTLVPWEGGGAVHQGFKAALEAVWNDRQDRHGRIMQGLKSYLDQQAGLPRKKAVWFTGHSLGAALATLAAQRYGQGAGLYTFGSPSIGDTTFAQAFTVPNYRLVNGADFVTYALQVGPYPPPGGGMGKYRHVGKAKYITEGSVLDTTEFTGTVLDWRCFRFYGLFALPCPLADHAPLLYADYLKKALGD